MNCNRRISPRKVEAAMQYANAGYPVLRVFGVRNDGTCRCHNAWDCSTPGKHPVGADWPEKATREETIIRGWFGERPDYNLGVLTGERAGIIVLDVDPRNGGDESLRELLDMLRDDAAARLQRTPLQITGGGGQHMVFRHPGRLVKTRANAMPGIDIRGDKNGMIVAEPSYHRTETDTTGKTASVFWTASRNRFRNSGLPFSITPTRSLQNRPLTGCRGATKSTQTRRAPRAPKPPRNTHGHPRPPRPPTTSTVVGREKRQEPHVWGMGEQRCPTTIALPFQTLAGRCAMRQKQT